jgi:UPF0755 protein
MKKFFIYITTLGLTLSIPSFLGILLSFSVPPSYDEKIVEVINIPVGARLDQVTHLLREKGVIRYQNLFFLLARWRGVDTHIKSGEYQFSNRMLPNDVLNKLIRGEQIKYSITIPEGFNLVQTAALYERMGLADKNKFIHLATDPTFIKSLGMNEETLEGYLFPDTYKFIRNIGERNIIRRMVQRFNEIYDQQFREREQELNLSRKEVITLASLIEKETGHSKERPIISAVFHNRLKMDMRLQCDPTVIYGLDNFTGDLTKKDLKTYTPYNTYLIKGLPPTPIANPGADSIQSALYPADVDYLYFVSKNDGTHYFSATLAEHNRVVNKYQRLNKYGDVVEN